MVRNPLHAQWEQQREQFFRNNPDVVENLGENIIRSPLPLVQRFLSAIIVEDSEETNGRVYDETQSDCLPHISEDCSYLNRSQIESDAENTGAKESETEQEGFGVQGGHKNRGKLQSSHQSSKSLSSSAANGISYEEMDLNRRILLELESIGIVPEINDTSICSFQPDPAESEQEEKMMGVCENELQHQVSKNKHHHQKVENATFKTQKLEYSECDVLAAITLVELASSRPINEGELQFGCRTWDSVSSNTGNDLSYEERIELFQESEVSKNKHHLQKMEKAAFKRRKIEDSKCEALAANTQVESASNRSSHGAAANTSKSTGWPRHA